MTGERLTGIDQGILLAERMLDNGEVLRTLIAGGHSKGAILQQVVSDLKHDPVGQACFLRTLFRSLASEGDLKVTNRRDTALAILTDNLNEEVRLTQVMTPLVEANPTIVHDAYIEALQQQTRENDPFSGSVDALLAVGKAIAPHLNQDAQRRQQIIDTWERVTQQFLTVYERYQIHSRVEEIKDRMSPVTQLDSEVQQLRTQGLTNPQIAQQLGRKESDIKASAHRLIAAKRIEPAPKGRPVTEAVTQLDNQVEQLRGQGLSNPQIAQQLGRKESDIKASARRLIAAKRIEPARSSTEAVTQLDNQVEQLRGQGLSNAQIAEKLERKRTDIEASAHRLIAAGRIEPARRTSDSATKLLQILQEFQQVHPTGAITLQDMANQLGVTRERARKIYDELSIKHTLPPKSGSGMGQLSEEYLAKLDQEVAKRQDQGKTSDQIAEELRVPSVWIKTSQRRFALQIQEQVKRDHEEFRRQVEQLRNQGIGSNRIAETLGKSISQIQYVVTGLVSIGDVQKMRQRKSQQELAPFDAKVKVLRAEGLTYQEMAERLGPEVSVSHILASVQRLQKRGEIELKSSHRNQSTSAQ